MGFRRLKRFLKDKTEPDLSRVQETITLRVDPAYDGWRVDLFLAELMNWHSRTKIQKLIQEGKVLKNNRRTFPGRKVRTGDEILLKLPPPDPEDFRVLQEGTLDIVYEDEHIVVINKPANLLVHPVGGRRFSSVINILHKYYRDPENPKKDIVPIIAHRIDVETSGALLAVKNRKLRKKIANLFAQRKIKKKYLAIVEGHLPAKELFVDLPIGERLKHEIKIARGINFSEGQPAQTIFRLYKRLVGFDVVECELLTGRQHQIRVHLEAVGNPLLCDPYYGVRRFLAEEDVAKIKAGKDEKAKRYTREYYDFFKTLKKIELDKTSYYFLDDIPPEVVFSTKYLHELETANANSPIGFSRVNVSQENYLISRTALHSWKLEFVHPATNELISIEAPVPADIKRVIDALSD